MSLARQESEWDRTAMIVAKIHNVNCAKTTDLIRDFSRLNPYRKQKPTAPQSLKEIRRMMEGGR